MRRAHEIRRHSHHELLDLTASALLQHPHVPKMEGRKHRKRSGAILGGGCLLWLPWRRCLKHMRRQAGHPLTQSAGGGRTVSQIRRQEVHQRKIAQQRHAALHASTYASVHR